MTFNLLNALCLVLIFASGNNNNGTRTFKQKDFMGTWVRTETTVESEGGCEGEEFVLTNTTITQTTICDGIAGGSLENEYTFDGKDKLAYDFFGAPYHIVIAELTSTTLKIEWRYKDHSFGTSTYEKK